jgi:hypothetical protein
MVLGVAVKVPACNGSCRTAGTSVSWRCWTTPAFVPRSLTRRHPASEDGPAALAPLRSPSIRFWMPFRGDGGMRILAAMRVLFALVACREAPKTPARADPVRRDATRYEV